METIDAIGDSMDRITNIDAMVDSVDNYRQ